MNQLGRLKRVPIHDAWRQAASHFTHWLTQAENIAQLNTATNLELRFEALNKGTGNLRQSLVCYDQRTETKVLIENQLAGSDHAHLGQLLTTASSVKATILIWIAEHFTPEHRATIEWLNQQTLPHLLFFAIELELWQIDDSPFAPHFKLICKPDDWELAITNEPSLPVAPAINNPSKNLYLGYWMRFNAMLRDRNSHLGAKKPHADPSTSFALGRADCTLQASLNARDNWLGVAVMLSGISAKLRFRWLRQQRVAIEQQLGVGLEWRENPLTKEYQIWLIRRNANLHDHQHWADHHVWMIDALERFYRVFTPLLKQLYIRNEPEQN
ncbi:DUF4268 domain-containing protein [Herpetosiphon llansteffanensis]